MPIMFRCRCGKVMQAREEHSGSRCKCVSCGMVLQIPAPQTLASGMRLETRNLEEKPAKKKGDEKSEEVETLPYPPPNNALPPHVPPPPRPKPSIPVRAPGMDAGRPPGPAWEPQGFPGRSPSSLDRSDEEDPDAWFQNDPRPRVRRRRRRVFLIALAILILLCGLALGTWFLVQTLGDKGNREADGNKKADPASLRWGRSPFAQHAAERLGPGPGERVGSVRAVNSFPDYFHGAPCPPCPT